MKKHKTKIIAAIVIVAALAGSWFLDSSAEINLPSQPILVTATEAQTAMDAELNNPTSSTAADNTQPIDRLADDGSFTVVLSVSANVLLYNMHLLHRDLHELVPPEGIIFPATQVTVYEGESVFEVLQREMRTHGIHMSSRFTPMFNSAYVEAINNLYEFDAGSMSGWMYGVNGWFPNFSSSLYILNPGDIVEWVYTLELGRDLGVYHLD